MNIVPVAKKYPKWYKVIAVNPSIKEGYTAVTLKLCGTNHIFVVTRKVDNPTVLLHKIVTI